MLVYFRLAAAILPAALLLLLVYKRDKNGKEPKNLLWRLIFAGGIIIIPIYICEVIGQIIVEFGNAIVTNQTELGFVANMFVYFGVVALAEEGFKMIALATQTWKNPNFNFKYDGIVYAVFVGMGFAIFENIKYVLEYGMVTGILRALTAIPQVLCMLYAIIIPIVGHGLYDFALTISNNVLSVVVSIFYMIILDIFSLVLLLYQSKHDQFIVGSARPRQVNPQVPQNQLQPTQMNSGYINQNDYGNYVNPTNVVPNMYDPNDFQRR